MEDDEESCLMEETLSYETSIHPEDLNLQSESAMKKDDADNVVDPSWFEDDDEPISDEPMDESFQNKSPAGEKLKDMCSDEVDCSWFIGSDSSEEKEASIEMKESESGEMKGCQIFEESVVCQPLPSQPVKPFTESGLCSTNCKNECHSVYESWTPDKKLHITDVTRGTTIVEKKNKLLSHLKSQARLGVDTDKFNFHGHYFCTAYFSLLSGLSPNILQKVHEAMEDNLVEFVHGNKWQVKEHESSRNMVAWFVTFLELNSQSSPDEDVFILPHWLSVAHLYEIYKKYTPFGRSW